MEENKKDKQLQVFDNSEFGKLTAIEIDGEPWFVAREVALVLGYQDTDQAVRNHCKSVKLFKTVELTGLGIDSGPRGMQVIPERDLYRLVMRSRLPAAERFEEWVAGEVLPSIRKTGSYQMQHKLPTTFAEALRQLADETEAKEKALLEIEENRPKVEFFDQVTGSEDAVDMASAAKVLNMGIGRNKLFAFLRDEKILMGNNQPYQQYVDQGYFRVIEQKYTKDSGEICISIKTMVYQWGLDFIRKRYQRR